MIDSEPLRISLPGEDKESLPKTRRQASSIKCQFYLPATPCVHGHASKRYTSTGQCVSCVKAKADALPEGHKLIVKEKHRQWRKRIKNKLSKPLTHTKIPKRIKTKKMPEIIQLNKVQDGKCPICHEPLEKRYTIDYVAGVVKGLLHYECKWLVTQVDKLESVKEYIAKDSKLK